MVEQQSHLRFLHRTRRRWFIWRTFEWGAICAFAGAVVGLMLVSVLIWRGEEALSPALILLGVGAIAGVVFGLTRRPTILQTAIEADRQLDLHDLLGTVLAKQTFGDPIFESVVLARAEHVCARLSPNDLVLRRLGGRAWGGIGITSAMLLTVAMMSARPGSSVAGGERFGPDDAEARNANVGAVLEHQAREFISTGSHRETASRGRNDSSEGDGPSDRSPIGDGRSQRAGKNAFSSRDATGSNAGRSANANVPDLKRPPGDVSILPDGLGHADNGVTDPASTGHVAPWNGQQWEADRQQAMHDLESGGIPDTYRDVIREYFQPEK
ncbi:MAG TPA: hypothetical protein VH518_17400 [Tepidisphaeraceae bacterium]|jgi:hypothetical protein